MFIKKLKNQIIYKEDLDKLYDLYISEKMKFSPYIHGFYIDRKDKQIYYYLHHCGSGIFTLYKKHDKYMSRHGCGIISMLYLLTCKKFDIQKNKVSTLKFIFNSIGYWFKNKLMYCRFEL